MAVVSGRAEAKFVGLALVPDQRHSKLAQVRGHRVEAWIVDHHQPAAFVAQLHADILPDLHRQRALRPGVADSRLTRSAQPGPPQPSIEKVAAKWKRPGWRAWSDLATAAWRAIRGKSP